jgi:nucleotide-binding universal stress UspA family protein
MNAFIIPDSVVACVDESEHAVVSARWAAVYAAQCGMSLRLVHAVNPVGAESLFTRLPYEDYRRDLISAADGMLHRVRDGLAHEYPALPITCETFAGDPIQALVGASLGARLLVAGTRGDGGFAGLRLGSVSARLAAHAQCPAVFIPEHGRGRSGAMRDEVVLGVEAGQRPEAVEFAFAEAARLGAALRAVHAWTPIPPYSGYYAVDPRLTLGVAEEELHLALKSVREQYPDVPVREQAVQNTPAAALIKAARGARLLVVGAHRHHGPFSLGIGHVLYPLLAHTPCPVAVIPATS